jgi:quercetin dioxygenase-like cupin family protein
MGSSGFDAFRHVNWDELPHEEARPGVRRKAIGNEEVMLVMNTCEPGMQVRPHSHDFAQIALFLEGRGILWVDGREHAVGPGSIVVIPAGQEHYVEPTGDETVVNLDVFAPARPDYRHLLDWMRE